MFQNSKQYLFSPFKQGSGTLLNLPEPIVDTIALTCDDTYKEYIMRGQLGTVDTIPYMLQCEFQYIRI